MRRDWVVERFEEAAAGWQAEFRRNLDLHGERIHCRRGCSHCCYQIFQISEPEAMVISRAVRRMSDAERADLQARAGTYLPQREALLREHGLLEAWGRLPPEGTRLPCPALGDDGACRIYESRPLICRKYGIPLYNPLKPGRVFACELNFQPGDEIDDPQLVQIQTGLYDEWKRTQEDYNARGGRRDEMPISVARAILEDLDL